MTKEDYKYRCKIEAMKVMLIELIKLNKQLPQAEDIENLTLKASYVGNNMYKNELT